MVHKLENMAMMWVRWHGYDVRERGIQAGCTTDLWIDPGTVIDGRE